MDNGVRPPSPLVPMETRLKNVGPQQAVLHERGLMTHLATNRWLVRSVSVRRLGVWVDYYHTVRPHQSMDNKPLTGDWPDGESDDVPTVVCRKRLGGLLKHYERKAA